MGELLGWEVALLPVAMLGVLIVAGAVASLAARRAGPWSDVQERTWEAIHGLDDVVRSGEGPSHAELRGRLGGARATVSLASTWFVVERTESSLRRGEGVRVVLELELAAADGELLARIPAPVDDEDDWKVSERPCAGLGEPFRADADAPDWLCRRLADAGAHLDGLRAPGWMRVGIQVAPGRVVVRGVSRGATLDDLLGVATAIAGPARTVDARGDPYRGVVEVARRDVAPPLPPPAPRTAGERLRVLASEATIESGLFLPAILGALLGLAGIMLERYIRPIEGTVREVRHDLEDGRDTVVLDTDGDTLSLGLELGAEAELPCPPGTFARKEPWSDMLTCTAGRVETNITPWGVVVVGTIGLFGVALLAGWWAREVHGRGPPFRLPETPNAGGTRPPA